MQIIPANSSWIIIRRAFPVPITVIYPYYPEETYDYILPNRKVVSCPSFASFRFSCQSYHVISIDSLTFSPVLLDSAGECTSGINILIYFKL